MLRQAAPANRGYQGEEDNEIVHEDLDQKDESHDATKKIFRLFDSPLDLWLLGCEMAAIYDNTIVISHRWHDDTLERCDQNYLRATKITVYQPSQPPITEVNRFLRSKLLSYFYHQNNFTTN